MRDEETLDGTSDSARSPSNPQEQITPHPSRFRLLQSVLRLSLRGRGEVSVIGQYLRHLDVLATIEEQVSDWNE